MRGHRDRYGPELRFLGEPQGHVDDATIGRDDQHALAFGHRALGLLLGLDRQRHEVERGVFGRDRQVALELELHHLVRGAGHRRQLDGLHGDRRAREADRHRAGRETSSIELRAQRHRGILGVDGERLVPITLGRRDGEPVAEHDDREPQRREIDSWELHRRSLPPLTGSWEKSTGP